MSAVLVPRPAILGRIPLDRHAVVEASAGTGKTFTLEHLIVELILRGRVELDRILVVSFTEKATGEIRARVRGKLEELVRAGPSPVAVDGEDHWVIDDDARHRLTAALRSFDGATIATIHAFCQRVLRENAFATGRLFREQQVDGRDAFGRAFRDTLRREAAPGRTAARWLEVALASGWSVPRLEQLLWRCADAHAELRPVFDPGALESALEGFPVDEAAGLRTADVQAAGVNAQTAKAFVARVVDLARAAERAARGGGAPSYVALADRIDYGYLVERSSRVEPRTSRVAEVVAAAVELARCTPSLQVALAHALLSPVREEARRRKRDAGQYDFDDMLTLVDEALRGARGPAIVAAMRDRWRYVLIDEFQDTDETQWSIFRRALFEDGPGVRSRLCLVGDPKQSIYGFRGADVQTYLRARDEIVNAGGGRVPLEANYRATPDLVDAINVLFDPGAPSPIFTSSIACAPATCGRSDRVLLDSLGRTPTPVHVLRCDVPRDARIVPVLADRIAREVRTMTDRARPWTFAGRALEPSDVFVLTRSIREGYKVAASLRAARVPYAFYKQDGLFQTDEAKEVRALLLAVHDPSDRARRVDAWLTPFFGVPLAALDRARDLPAAHPLVARLQYWNGLAATGDLDRLFDAILTDSGVLRREIFFGDDERRMTNYLHVFELLAEQAARSRSTLREIVHVLSGLIERTRLPLDLEGNVQRLESERRAVQIMTIHKAKGLQAPVVFVVGGFGRASGDDARTIRVYHEGGRRVAWVGSDAPKAIEERYSAEDTEENERLMYVALTRAQGRLYLPLAVSGSEPRKLGGTYGVVNRRLADVVAERNARFSVEDVTYVPQESESPSTRAPGSAAPVDTAVLVTQHDDAARFAELRRARAGALVTSYTRLKADLARDQAAPDGPRVARAESTARAAAPRTAPLRGARVSGILLHELLERVPLDSFSSADVASWRARPDVSAVFDEAAAAYDVGPTERDDAERIVWRAYATPFELPGGRRIARLAATARAVREMPFVFAAARGTGGAQSTAPGFVRGSIDLAFEYEGLVYFVDWKSDTLASYDPADLGRHVASRYDTQARLYALAVAKLLGVRSREDHDARFGGMLYCFVRGLDEAGRGLWSSRPTWDELCAWDRSTEALLSSGGRG